MTDVCDFCIARFEISIFACNVFFHLCKSVIAKQPYHDYLGRTLCSPSCNKVDLGSPQRHPRHRRQWRRRNLTHGSSGRPACLSNHPKPGHCHRRGTPRAVRLRHVHRATRLGGDRAVRGHCEVCSKCAVHISSHSRTWLCSVLMKGAMLRSVAPYC